MGGFMKSASILMLFILLFPVAVKAGNNVSYIYYIPTEVSQGELVVAQVDPRIRLFQDGQERLIAEDGILFLSFARDAEPISFITIITPSGEQEDYEIVVKPRDWKTTHIKGLPDKMVTPPKEVLARIADDNKKIAEVRQRQTKKEYFRSGFIMPAKGRISDVFGSQRILNDTPRRFHNGVDIAAPIGTPIIAPADGVVALAEKDMYYTGGTVMLDHGYGLTTVYAHMDRIDVDIGQEVQQGVQIGTIGKTGRASGPHLHWGMTHHSTHVEPTAFTVAPLTE